MQRRAAVTFLALAGLGLLIELARGGVPWTPAFLLCLGAVGLLFAADPRPWESRPASLLFWGCAAMYLSSFRWHGGDDLPTSLVPFALLRDGTFLLDRWIDPFLAGKTNDFTLPAVGGHSISIFPVAAALLALPVYVVPALAGVVPTDQFLHNVSKVSAAFIVAGSVVFLYKAAAERSSPRWALGLAAVYGLGSWAFSVSSQALWQHGPACLGLAVGVWGLSREGPCRDALAGFGFAFAVASRPDSFWVAAPAGLYVLLHRTRRVPGFAAGAAVPATLLAAYWLYYTGRLAPPESGFQGNFFIGFQPQAFAALLLSPTRGILFFSPWLLFGAWAALRRGGGAEARWLLAGSVASWVFFSCYSPWVGGTTFGSRYFAGVALLMAYVCSGAEDWVTDSPARLRLFALAGALSVLVHALGAYLNWPGSAWIGTAKAQVWWWTLHPWVFLFNDEGPLKALPWVVRAAAALGGVGVAAWGAASLTVVDNSRKVGLSSRMSRAAAGR